MLRDAGVPSDGVFDFEVHLYDDPDSVSANLLGTAAIDSVVVEGGLFALPLDFGQTAFNGDERWLEIRVRPEATGDFMVLSPLQRLAPAPYALHALSAPSSGVDLSSDQTIDGIKTFVKPLITQGDVTVGDDLFVDDFLQVNDDVQIGTPSLAGSLTVYSSSDALRLFRVGGQEFGRLYTNNNDDLILRSPGGRLRTQEDLYLQFGEGTSWRELHAGDVNVHDTLWLNEGSIAKGSLALSADNVYLRSDEGSLELRDHVYLTGQDDRYLTLGPLGGDFIRFVEGPFSSRDLDLHLGRDDNGQLQIFGSLRVKESVDIEGNLSKLSGSFRIDHPLDPENRYLVHSFVESPDMMNVYNGNVTTDGAGEAWVELPSYFEALNIDYRYQLTVLGTFAQAIIAKEISHNRFLLRTDQPYVKVSWQVTGVRNDDWARENRLVSEPLKPAEERGQRLYEPRRPQG